MEANPPSYRQATAVNAWDIVAEYISSSDLCSAALVCQEWHSVFVPHLWGNPASYFGHENDRVYVALTRFKRALPWARRSVRSLTHTLHLPPAHAEIYNGPHSDWLRDVLEGLPNLQSLIVRGLPFFDHSALTALRFTRSPGNRNTLVPWKTPFGLRLLDASRCGNVTSSGLQQALLRFDALLYLDLSWTYPAKDSKVLQTLGHFSGLQILKLRGISLRDDDVRVLAGAIKTRVRSLDVRNNLLTDRSVRVLLDECFTPPPQRHNDGQVSSPSLLPYVGAEMLSIYRGHQFEAYMRKEFASKFVGRLAIEDAPESGITHLYISDNLLTVEGLSGLIRSGRLHVFDAGSLEHDMARHSSLGYEGEMTFPGEEKLIPVLAESASHSLTYLRIDHSLVTNQPANCNEEEVLPGRSELPAVFDETPVRAELDSGNEVFEMLGDTSYRNELPGDPIPILVTSTTDESRPYRSNEGTNATQTRRGSSDAPIPVYPETDHDCTLHVTSIENTSSQNSNPNMPSRARQRTYSSVVSERKTRLQSHLSQSKGFHPGILPHLHTLILTSVPAFTTSPTTSSRLITLIHNCAKETSLATLQSRLDWTLPPNHSHTSNPSSSSHHYHHHLQNLRRKSFALEQITLELSPQTPGKGKKASKVSSAWRHQGTKSVTQDPDSESLWKASSTDFSFFTQEGETEAEAENLGWGLEPERPFPLSIMSGLEPCTVTRTDTSTVPQHSTGRFAQQERTRRDPRQQTRREDRVEEPSRHYDTISQISNFRKEKKMKFEERMAMVGEDEAEVEGYWQGNVRVIRRAGGDGDSRFGDGAEVWADYYGNRFTGGYLYR